MDFIPTPEHRLNYRVPFFEVDAGMALYHGNYFHLFEIARTQFMREVGFPYVSLMERERHLSVVEARCRYRKPLRYDDEVVIVSRIVELSSRSVTWEQKIFRGGDERPSVAATLVFVCVSFSGSAVRLPDEFGDALRQWTSDK